MIPQVGELWEWLSDDEKVVVLVLEKRNFLGNSRVLYVTADEVGYVYFGPESMPYWRKVA
jgi:hypothetical protein